MMEDFMLTEWFVPEVDNWHLKEGAPPDVVKAFEDYKRRKEEALKNGVILD